MIRTDPVQTAIDLMPSSRLVLFIAAVWLCLFTVRITAPPDLRDNDQERPVAYIMDVVQNGNWFCQRDYNNVVASKPPLYTWLAALATFPFERINRFSIYIPCGLSILGVAVLLFRCGRALGGQACGLMAALVYLLSGSALKQVCLARTDPVFSLTVACASVLAYLAWVRGRGWTLFWLAAAAATLAKGPLGLLLGAGGLCAWFWERRSGGQAALRGNHATGIVLFFLITGAWFVLALSSCGQDLIDKLIFQELVGHAVKSGKGKLPGQGFYKPTFYLLTRFLPWSIFACIGFWRIFRRPEECPDKRRMERFAACHVLFGLGLFSLAAHQRSDLIFPLLPAAALIAGRELARILPFLHRPRALARLSVAIAVLLLLAAVFYQFFFVKKYDIQETLAIRRLARTIERELGPEAPLQHVNACYTLQFYLNSLHRFITREEAARLLELPESAFIAGRPLDLERARITFGDTGLYEIASCAVNGKKIIAVYSNYPDFKQAREKRHPRAVPSKR